MNLDDGPEIRSVEVLAKARLELAQKATERVFQQFIEAAQNPPGRRNLGAILGLLHTWNRRELDARLELADSRQERLVAYSLYFNQTQSVQEAVRAKGRGAALGMSELDLMALDDRRLEAEMLLSHEREAK